jgi:hypothetical protein
MTQTPATPPPSLANLIALVEALIDAAQTFGYTQSNSTPAHAGYQRDAKAVEVARLSLLSALEHAESERARLAASTTKQLVAGAA